MMDQHRSEYCATVSEAFHPAFFSIADRLGCPEQRYCNGLILFGCVAIAERATVSFPRAVAVGFLQATSRTATTRAAEIPV